MRAIPTEPGEQFEKLLRQVRLLEEENLAKAIPKELLVPRVWRGLFGFGVSGVLYIGAIALTSVTHWSLWPALWILAGLGGWGLHCIGHDCGHGSFSRSKVLNVVIGQVSLLPLLFPFHAWRHAHNSHHMNTNSLERDFDWRPIDYDAYLRLGRWGRLRYLGERSLFFWIGTLHFWVATGFQPKLFPYDSMRDQARRSIWFMAAWLATYVPILVYFTGGIGLLKYFVAPWIATHAWFATTTLMHHTSEDLPFLTRTHWRFNSSRLLLTTDYNYPKWLLFLTHNISIHTAHHVAPVLPFYNLPQAREALKRRYPGMVREEPFSFGKVLRIVSRCHFFDPKHGYYLSLAQARARRGSSAIAGSEAESARASILSSP